MEHPLLLELIGDLVEVTEFDAGGWGLNVRYVFGQ